MNRLLYILLFLILISFIGYFYSLRGLNLSDVAENSSNDQVLMPPIVNYPDKEKLELKNPSVKKTLKNDYHIFQTFNNCGPASFSMALSYYNINVTQKVLGDKLRPYRVVGGDNDDKSVTLEELADIADDYNLTAYHRPSGDIDKIKLFITYDIPIVTRTWLKVDDDIGHYRVIKGYDDERKVIIQDDSLQGKNLEYTYNEFFELWKKYNYEYLVLAPKEKIEIAEAILDDDLNETNAWEKAVELSQNELNKNPDDVYAGFNLSVALYKTGKYKESVAAFERIQGRISSRTLWYQIEPILAYYQLENYEKVFEITNEILNNHNRAFSELYILRGRIYEKQNKLNQAKAEFEKAKLYNRNIDINNPLILE